MSNNEKTMHWIFLHPCKELNDYIQGRITGIIYVLIGMPDICWAWMRRRDGVEYMRFECTDEQYQTILNAIDKDYGRLIERGFVVFVKNKEE